MIRFLLAVAMMSVTGCGNAKVEAQQEQAEQPLDVSQAAREEAAIQAATLHFNQTIKQPLLVQKRMTVRGLARRATLPAKTPGRFHASRYDPTASSSEKLELIDGRVIYTVAAAAHDESAGVISDGETRWLVGYELQAALTPDGELEDFVFHRLGPATRAD